MSILIAIDWTSTLFDYVLVGLVSLGTLFVLLAGLGVVRMPDLYLRISVTTKAATLGVGLILLGAAIHFGETSVTTRILAIILFLLLTAPVSAHLIGKASYYVGRPLWRKSVTDELRDSERSSSLLGLTPHHEEAKDIHITETDGNEVVTDRGIGDDLEEREKEADKDKPREKGRSNGDSDSENPPHRSE